MGFGSPAAALQAVRVALESLGYLGQVAHTTWASRDSLGAPVGASTTVSRQAHIAEGTKQRHTTDGRLVCTRACITFFALAEDEEPPVIGMQDKLVTPSGLTGPIVEIEAAHYDPSSGLLVRVVWIG